MREVSREVSVDKNGWRTTKIAVEGARHRTSKSVYAVCVKSDDPDFLTVSRLYRVDVTGEYATLTDNQGEVSVYPLDFFLQLPLSRVTKTQIAAALSI
jgi:hypothetical protein